MGTVYWITGLSGAGKTTIGKLFYNKMKEKYINTVFLDGDTLRDVFGNDLSYTLEDRKKCAMRYAKLCKMLQEQGMNVVCCTISMFDSIREWNRENSSNYKEIYIKVSMDVLNARDQKKLYSRTGESTDTPIVGREIQLEEPKKPDLVLENNGDILPEEQAEKIWDKFVLKI